MYAVPAYGSGALLVQLTVCSSNKHLVNFLLAELEGETSLLLPSPSPPPLSSKRYLLKKQKIFSLSSRRYSVNRLLALPTQITQY